MLFWIGKILQLFLWPENWCLLGMALALVLLRRGKIRAVRMVLIVSLVTLTTASLPIISQGIIHSLERYPARPISEYPSADAIIVLGGSTNQRLGPPFDAEEIREGRLLAAARLFGKHKGKIIVVSGGLPYRGWQNAIRTDAEDMQDVLVDMGVPPEAILKEERSRNTLENAQYSLTLLRERGLTSALIVSSSYHLRRAMALFQREGKGQFSFVPVPTGMETGGSLLIGADFLPNALSLYRTSLAIKEYVGYFAVSF
jgi:uncharacterized SAM-binding protein YcdF (DUF218 family)